jgi:mercuric ion binding protein
MKNSILKSIAFLAIVFFSTNLVSAQKTNQKAVIKTFFKLRPLQRM